MNTLGRWLNSAKEAISGPTGAAGYASEMDVEGDPVVGIEEPQEQVVTRNEARVYFWESMAKEWRVTDQRVKVEVYDENEERSGTRPHYILSAGSAEVSVGNGNRLMFIKKPKGERKLPMCFFTDDDGTSWALRFATEAGLDAVREQVDDARFQTMFKAEPTAENKRKHLGDYEHFFRGEDPAPPEEMAWEKPQEGHAGGYQESVQVDEGDYVSRGRGSGHHKLHPGALENTFCTSPGGVDVFRNRKGGLDDPGVHVDVRDIGTNQNVTPQQMLLAERESTAFYLTPSKNAERESKGSERLGELNLEAGKVVKEWTASLNGVEVPVQEVASETKAAQTEHSRTFKFLDENRLGTFDARTKEGVVQSTLEHLRGKTFSRVGFTCMATTGEGQVAVGDRDGAVRLFADESKSAKTKFPGFGAPITAIDVTYDGSWILATTDDCLMLFYARFTNDQGSELSGFKYPMGKKAPAPRILRLTPQHKARCGNQPLREGKFTWVTDPDQGGERHIVATCGTAYIVFNFPKLKEELKPGAGKTISTNYSFHQDQAPLADAKMLHSVYWENPDDQTVASATESGDVKCSHVRRRFSFSSV